MKLSNRHIREALKSWQWRAYRGETALDPDTLQIGPNSVDITLHPKLLYPLPGFLTPAQVAEAKMPPRCCPGFFTDVDPRKPETLQWGTHDMTDEGMIIWPGQFLLGAATERFDCDKPLDLDGGTTGFQNTRDARVSNGTVLRRSWFAQMYDGRSTCGRLGLASHVTAGFGDYGFKGAFTLELVNHAPYAILLRPGMRIGQVAFEEVSEPAEDYRGAYSGTNHNDGPVPPLLGPKRF